MSLVFQVLTILFFAVLNGILAMSETAVVSARRARLRRLAESGDEKARAALDLATDPTQFLATIQIGITLIGIVAGAFGEATLARVIASALLGIPALVPYAHAIAITVVVLGLPRLRESELGQQRPMSPLRGCLVPPIWAPVR